MHRIDAGADLDLQSLDVGEEAAARGVDIAGGGAEGFTCYVSRAGDRDRVVAGLRERGLVRLLRNRFGGLDQLGQRTDALRDGLHRLLRLGDAVEQGVEI